MTGAETRALQKLADIAVPPPVPWTPQTWGWAVLGTLLLAGAAWVLWRWHRRREANRYRTEALAELERIRNAAEIPPLLKRVALAAWPRDKVASLNGAEWVAFLEAEGPLAELLDDAEYSSASVPGDEAKAAAKRWIEGHRVPA